MKFFRKFNVLFYTEFLDSFVLTRIDHTLKLITTTKTKLSGNIYYQFLKFWVWESYYMQKVLFIFVYFVYGPELEVLGTNPGSVYWDYSWHFWGDIWVARDWTYIDHIWEYDPPTILSVKPQILFIFKAICLLFPTLK